MPAEKFVRVCVNSPRVQGVFDYHIPNELIGLISPGCLVEVHFGKQIQQGIVLDLVAETDITDTRPVEHLIDTIPVLTSQQLALGKWMEAHSFATLAQCIHQMVFPGLNQQYDLSYSLSKTVVPATFSKIQERILSLLINKGSMRGRQIDTHFARIDWKPSMQKLVKLEIVSAKPELPRSSLNPRLIRMAQLAVSPEMADPESIDWGRSTAETISRRKEVLAALIAYPGPQEVQWLPGFDKAKRLADITWLAEKDLVQVYHQEVFRDPVQRIQLDDYEEHNLNEAQQKAWQQIADQIKDMRSGRKPVPIFINGVTGSGKTELYFRAIEEVIKTGRQVLYLLPEISLTPQTVGRLSFRFPGKVGLVHSRLSDGERYDTWRRARAGKIPIIAGPRSAFFTPLPDIGLIVIDESHDSSFYQSETPPYANIVDLAGEYARYHNALLIQGTATPDVSRYFLAGKQKELVFTLPYRATRNDTSASNGQQSGLAEIRVVDMREELKEGNRSIFSRELQQALCDNQQRGDQSILFLNRRGTATHIFCRRCGYVLYCKHCCSPLTGHGSEDNLKCHFCGRTTAMPRKCPRCQSEAIRAVGSGTEGVEQQISKLLPEARILRWDADTTQQKGIEEISLNHFKNRQYDILIGTQMISKGLDFPGVTLVGMVLADIGLHLPDYRSPERVFQMLTQVAGRAGRGTRPGRVVLQTYQPEHYAIQSAAAQSFENFSTQELEHRKALRLPPFGQLIRIEIKDTSEEKAKTMAEQLANKIKPWLQSASAENVEVIGPAPCFFSKVRDIYRWQIVLKGEDPHRWLHSHKSDLYDLRVEVDPANLL